MAESDKKRKPEQENNVNIFARCRPFQDWEDGNLFLDMNFKDNVVGCQNNGYAFKKIFGEQHKNEDLLPDVVDPLIDKILNDGVDAMLVAYGTTGSGKTYSFVGNFESDPPVLGIMPMTLQRLLELRPDIEMSLSVIEAYSDNLKAIVLYDLLKPRKEGNQLRRTNFLKSLTKQSIKSIPDVTTHIRYAFKQAHIFPTQKNPRSSRGHTVYMAELKFDGDSNFFMFCDLAGAEGHKAVNAAWASANGIPQRVLVTRQLEAGCINIGLTEFAMFLEELAGKRQQQRRKGDGLRFLMSETLGPRVLHTQAIHSTSHIEHFTSVKLELAVLFTLSPSDANESSTKKTLEQAVHFGTFKFGNLKKKTEKRELVQELRLRIEELTNQLNASQARNAQLEDLLSKHDVEYPSLKGLRSCPTTLAYGGDAISPAAQLVDELSDLLDEDSDMFDMASGSPPRNPRQTSSLPRMMSRSMTVDDLFDVQQEIENTIEKFKEQHNLICKKLECFHIAKEDVEDYASRLEGICTNEEIEEFLSCDQLSIEFRKKLKLPNARKSRGYGFLGTERKENGTVYIHILGAKNLKARQSANPYCKIKVNGERLGKTEPEMNTVNPTWEKVLCFPISSIEDEVEIAVWDHSKYGRQKEIGSIKITVREIIDSVREFYKTVLPSPLSSGGVINVMFDYHEDYQQSLTLLDLYDNVVDNLIGSGKCKCGRIIQPHMKYCFNCGTKRTYLMHIYAFKQLLYSVQIEVTPEKLNELFSVMDADDNGYIQFWEFQAFLNQNNTRDQLEHKFSREELRDTFLKALKIPSIVHIENIGEFHLQQLFVTNRPYYICNDAFGEGETRYMYYHRRHKWIVTESRFQISNYDKPKLNMHTKRANLYVPPKTGWVKALDDGSEIDFGCIRYIRPGEWDINYPDPYPANAGNTTQKARTFCCEGLPGNSSTVCKNPRKVDIDLGVLWKDGRGIINDTDYCEDYVTYDEAESFCRTKGLRLCTVNELMEGNCGKNCNNVGRVPAWSSSTLCDSHFINDDDVYHCQDYFYLCPYGMHKVAAPTRSDDYEVTANVENYTPGELVEIKVITKNPIKKILGLLLYAVADDGMIGASGGGSDTCPFPGCDGSQEQMVGTFEVSGRDKHFQNSPNSMCSEHVVTHQHAQLKKYTETFYWRAPEKGTGDVIFRALVKQGSTNGGYFYWPMTEGDLTLKEGSDTNHWYRGPASQHCHDICADIGQGCNGGITRTIEVYEDVKRSFMCEGSPVSTCSPGFPTKGADDRCYMYNVQSTQCEKPLHYFTCCKDGEDSCWSPCLGLKTRAEAAERCAARGWRLCSKNELISKQCCDSHKCNEPSSEMWTADTFWDYTPPAKKVCENCRCENIIRDNTTEYRPTVYNGVAKLDCIGKAASGDNKESLGPYRADYYQYFEWRNSTVTGDNLDQCRPRPDFFCAEMKKVNNGQNGYSIWKLTNTPPTELQDNMKFGSGSPQSLLDSITCMHAALGDGKECFSWDDDDNTCVIPVSNSECSSNDTHVQEANSKIWLVNDAGLTEKTYVVDMCSGVSWTEDVSHGNAPEWPTSEDLCYSTETQGVEGEHRLCQCTGAALYASHDTKMIWLSMWAGFGGLCCICCVVIIYFNDCRNTASYKNPYEDFQGDRRGSVETFGSPPPPPKPKGLPKRAGLPKRQSAKGLPPPGPPKRSPVPENLPKYDFGTEGAEGVTETR